ncbi:MAG: hypothetical protein ACPKPY_12585 [Nitrososphaeraceae archaeon]
MVTISWNSNNSILLFAQESMSNNLTTYGTLNIVSKYINGTSFPSSYIIKSDIPESQSFEIDDNSDIDLKNSTIGVISLSNIQYGNYTITQNFEDLSSSSLSKFVQINNDNPNATVIFINKLDDQKSIRSAFESKIITYTAKFVCGSVRGDEGPLRPGHYDTDIGIYNKQNYPLVISWYIVPNDEIKTNTILTKLSSESATGITCSDFTNLLNIQPSDTDLIEGFIIVEIDLLSNNVFSLSRNQNQEATLSSSNFNNDNLDLVDVHVFYTANALDYLPHEILIDKIKFQILNDNTNKIPKSLLNKDLEISVRSIPNEIIDQEKKIKNILSNNYNLTKEESNDINLIIQDTDVGVGSMIDDHAISLFKLTPELK